MLSKCTLLEYPLLTGMDPLVVHCPPVGKENASTNQRPFCHSMWSDRGHVGGRPQPIRGLPTIGCGEHYRLLLEFLLYSTLWTGAVGGTPTA